MKRLLKILALAVLAVVLLGAVFFFTMAGSITDSSMNTIAEGPLPAVSDETRTLHKGLVIADMHADSLLWSRDPLDHHDRGHVDVPRLIAGNVALQVFSAVTKSPWGLNYQENEAGSDSITLLAMGQRWPLATWSSLKARALYQAERLHEAADNSDGKLTVIHSVAELDAFLRRRAEEPDIVAGLLAIEGLHAMEAKLENLDELYEAGYRMMAATHFFDNAVSGSAHGVERGGLTELGRAVTERMEALGIVVDLAHVSPRAIDEILAMVTRPVVVSHTGVKATCDGPRNLSDEQIRAIAKTGGVIGIGYWPGAVCDVEPAAIVRAMRHVVELVGVEHVGLGSDFDGTVHTGFDTTGLDQVTEALRTDGFSDADIAAIMGGNVIRVLRQTLPKQ